MLLKSDVSCSSVHAFDFTVSVPKSAFIGIGVSSAGSTASPAGVDAALEGRRTFFLGGMAVKLCEAGKVLDVGARSIPGIHHFNRKSTADAIVDDEWYSGPSASSQPRDV